MSVDENAVSGRRLVAARSTQFVVRTLAVGLPTGLVLAWHDAVPFARWRDVALPLVRSGFGRGLLVAALAMLAWLALFRAMRARIGGTASSHVATLVAFAYPTYLLVREVNYQLMPGVMELGSLIGNAFLLPAVCALAWATSHWLLAWQRGAWRTGRQQPVALIGLVAIPLGVLAVEWCRPRDRAPDVLVLLVDVLGADHLGCYGYPRPTSPNIDRLAADSIVFEDLSAASTFTKTSIASLFTGRPAHRHGVYTGSFAADPTTIESDTLEPRFTTLAESLFEHGMNTAAWVQNGQLRAYMGFDQGFTLYHDQPGNVELIADSFARWRARWGREARYFAYLHVLDLHAPYGPPLPYRGTFSGRAPLSTADLDFMAWEGFKSRVLSGERVLAEDEVAEFTAKYDELILYVDDWVGRIIDDLKSSGRYDDTLIVLTSDHGEAFWEHGFISHSNAPYEELVHVPLIVKMPGSAGAGRRVADLVGTIDIAPTLIEFAGAEPPPDIEGESFLPLLLGEEAPLEPRQRFQEYLSFVGIRTERWKFISRPSGAVELYDLEADPGELSNCIDVFPDVAEELGAAAARAAEIRGRIERPKRVVVDPETVEALRALGYL